MTACMKTAIVTGANRGLGLETAATLARRGYRVWLTGRDADSTEQAAISLRAEGLQVQPGALDVASDASVQAFAAQLGDSAVDALVNNAGASLQGFSAEVAQTTLDVNYRGAVRVTDALRNRLSPTANIVMVSSGMGDLSHFSRSLQQRLLSPTLERSEIEQVGKQFVQSVANGTHSAEGFPSNAYSVSKALMNAFTRVLARELAPSEQRVNAVCPGWVKTRMGGSGAPRTLSQGAGGIVWAALLTSGSANGGYFATSSPSTGDGRARCL